MTEKACITCGKIFGINETTCVIKMPVKPKGCPNRYVIVGHACDNDRCDNVDITGYAELRGEDYEFNN